MSEPKTYPLKHPLKHPIELRRASDGEVVERINALELRRLTGGDARRVLNARDKGSGEMIAALVCASARIPPATFDQLDAEDVSELAEVCAPFLGQSPKT